MQRLLPSGVLGVAITGLFASFMAGVAANVSSLNTVVTYDLLQPYVAQGPRGPLLPERRPAGHRRRRS